jgi:acylphosphatase
LTSSKVLSNKRKKTIFANKKTMNCIHYNIKVTGKVQGVWFRKYTKDKADKLGLLGTVQNQPDGSVYIEVEGSSAETFKQFTDWLYEGSPLSKVADVIVEAGDECLGYKDFEIKR